MSSIDEALVKKMEEENPQGLTSSQILGFFSAHGLAFSEATLRKYVQLGLLPRSVRVGQKGKHRGSKGLYPVRVVRQILLIKEMLSRSYTIEQIQKQFVFLRADLDQLEESLATILEKLRKAASGDSKRTGLALHRDLGAARGMSEDLMTRLRALESRVAPGPLHEGQEAVGA